MLLQGSRSPIFHSYLKLHNTFLNFPELKPICSESDSCSKRSYRSFSEQDKIFRFCIKRKKFLSIMGVKELYNNIDQEEGGNACKNYLDRRKNPPVT